MKKTFKLTHKPRQLPPQNPAVPISAVPATSEKTSMNAQLEEDDSLDRPRVHDIVAGTQPRPSLAELPHSQRRDRGVGGTAAQSTGPTTRKTIEVPEEYFFLVKMRALQRRIKEKEMWAEILAEYFASHPEA